MEVRVLEFEKRGFTFCVFVREERQRGFLEIVFV